MVSDVLVLGGGLAGGAAALELARSGVLVQLLERETGPHDKICGEFLSVEAGRELLRLGIDVARLGAVPIDRVRLVRGHKRIEAALPFMAQGIGRKCLDEAVLEAAETAGVRVARGVKVTALDGAEAQTSAGPCRSGTILLATGKRDIRGAGRLSSGWSDDYVGFKMHWRLPARQRAELAGAVELVLFDGGYAGLQRVSEDVLNLCLLVRRERLAALGGGWEGLLAELMREPHIARRIGDAEALFARPLSVANLPYGYVYDGAARVLQDVYRLGDQAALTAPLTGDGMAIALRSARLAATAIGEGAGAASYHRRLRAEVAPQVRRAMALQGAAQAPFLRLLATAVLGLCPSLLGRFARLTRLAEFAPA